jgi:hypothetical protein
MLKFGFETLGHKFLNEGESRKAESFEDDLRKPNSSHSCDRPEKFGS